MIGNPLTNELFTYRVGRGNLKLENLKTNLEKDKHQEMTDYSQANYVRQGHPHTTDYVYFIIF